MIFEGEMKNTILVTHSDYSLSIQTKVEGIIGQISPFFYNDSLKNKVTKAQIYDQRIKEKKCTSLENFILYNTLFCVDESDSMGALCLSLPFSYFTTLLGCK